LFKIQDAQIRASGQQEIEQFGASWIQSDSF